MLLKKVEVSAERGQRSEKNMQARPKSRMDRKHSKNI
jgi:hypothetical protein